MYCLVVIVTEILLHLLILENAEGHEVYLNYLEQSHLLNFESCSISDFPHVQSPVRGELQQDQ